MSALSLGAVRRWSWRVRGAAVAVVVLVGAAAVTWWVTAGSSSASAACPPSAIPSHDSQTLIVEGDPWSGYAPFRDEKLLDSTGYKTKYVEQICQDIRMGDLTAGRADLAVTTLDQYLILHPNATVVGIIDQSQGADALALGTVHHKGLDSIDDLPGLVEQYKAKGRKPVLAYTGNSPSEMLLNELANATDELKLSDFQLAPVDQSATAWKMLQADEAQLAVIWEPDTSAARAAGYTITLSSADVPNSIVDVILASDRLISRDPAAVQAAVDAFYRRMDHYLTHRDELRAFYAQDGGLDAKAAASVIDGIKLYGAKDADTFLNQAVFPLDSPQMAQSVDSIGSVLALTHPGIEVERAKVDGRYAHTAATGGAP